MYLAYKFTNNQMKGEIAPVRWQDVRLTTDVEEKEKLLFKGMFIIEIEADLMETLTPPVQEYPLLRRYRKKLKIFQITEQQDPMQYPMSSSN
ncbi:hypothetical protein O181_128104 [Austropuccinia psidii MF-1]|uniref:Uncharacterized protein n=1 Tax=Austropuccinia psidii MF-1 TaxID=1389203 RepID=A0A9Q3KWJ4_9BASI|nr:hypothetical protein [Austropuccinia psidii MF-1]